MASIWFLAKFVRYTLPPLFPEFQAVYGVSNATLGLVYTTMMLVYALMQFPSGVLADKFSPPHVIVGGLVTAMSGVFFLSWPGSFLLLAGGMVLVGLGTGVHKTVAVAYLSQVYSERKGRSLGVLDTFGTTAGVAAPAAVVVLANTHGREVLFLGSGCVGLILAGVFLTRASTTPEAVSQPTDAASVADYIALFRNRRFSAFVVVSVTYAFTYNGIVAFLPLYLTESTPLNSTFATVLYGVLFAVSFVQLLTGDLSDRLGSLLVIAGTTLIALLGLVGILIGSTPVALGAAVAFFGVGAHGFRPVRGAYLVKVVPDSLAGGGLGAVRSILMGAGALSPAVVGYVSDSISFRVSFAVLLLSLVVTVVTAFGLLVTE
ncbi:MFS transporter [Haloarcula marina]|uniref:MFS transporter n=1 Tax=Haloarcula marina TaxID=2961574 RepID=UPI0020B7F49D|nr:MFS transporter [Halomicroarcula marina]